MGFRFKRVDLTAGSTEFPTGSTAELIQQRSKTILTKVVDAIVASGTGWSLDTVRSATSTSYSAVPCLSGSGTFPGLFLRNMLSGCKMFLAYFGGTNAETDVIANLGQYYSVTGTTVHSGLICSIIPGESSNDFGNSFNSSFLPSDATPIIGSVYYTTTSGGYTCAHGCNPSSGYTYSWGIFVTKTTLCVSSANYYGSAGGNIVTPIYVAGRIFGSLMNLEDSQINSKYGVVTFRYRYGSGDQEGWSGEFFYSVILFGESFNVPGIDRAATSYGYNYSCGCFSKSDGTWINGTDGSSYSVYFCVQSPEMLSNNVFSSSGRTFWTPIYMLVKSNNPSIYCVHNGNAIKGFLDTDLFRFARGIYGQKFSGDHFIIINSDVYSAFAIGWSPENTESIVGS